MTLTVVLKSLLGWLLVGVATYLACSIPYGAYVAWKESEKRGEKK